MHHENIVFFFSCYNCCQYLVHFDCQRACRQQRYYCVTTVSVIYRNKYINRAQKHSIILFILYIIFMPGLCYNLNCFTGLNSMELRLYNKMKQKLRIYHNFGVCLYRPILFIQIKTGCMHNIIRLVF